MISVGIVGGSGYTGAELLRLCAGHPEFDVQLATGDSQAGTKVADLYPSLGAAYGDLTFTRFSAEACSGLDLVFCGLPHGQSQAIVPDLQSTVKHVVDLAADFRFRDASVYPTWYGEAHSQPDLLADFVYGLPELTRDELRSASLIAAAGCYPTAATLALWPLIKRGLVVRDGIVVDAA